MATTAQHIAARSDTDLTARVIAAAEQDGIESARDWVMLRLGRLISTPVDGTQTIADVHAYASDVRAQQVAALPPLPGANLAAVTDTHIRAAITALAPPETTVTPPEQIPLG